MWFDLLLTAVALIPLLLTGPRPAQGTLPTSDSPKVAGFELTTSGRF